MAITDNTQFGRVGAFRFWCQKVLPAVYDDSLSYYELLCKVTKWLEDLTNVTNTQSDAITELQETLAEFMADHFDPYIEEKIDEWFDTNQPDIMSDISSLQTNLSTLEGTVSTLQKQVWDSTKYSGTNIVVFGDSYTQAGIANSNNGQWVSEVSNALNVTAFNYALAGAGWARPSNPVSIQQTIAENGMTTAQKNNTSIAIAMLGVNDLLNLDDENITQSMIVSGISNFITWANNTFTNAQVIIVPFAFGFGGLRRRYLNMINDVMSSIGVGNAAHRRGVLVIDKAWTWNLGIASRFLNSVHPGVNGYHVIASRILTAIHGSQYNEGVSGSYSFTSADIRNDSQRCQYYCQDGIVHVDGYIRPLSAYTSRTIVDLETSGSIPAIMTPVDSFIIIPLWNSTQSKNSGEIQFFADGSCRAVFTDVNASDVCLFHMDYPAEVGATFTDYL